MLIFRTMGNHYNETFVQTYDSIANGKIKITTNMSVNLTYYNFRILSQQLQRMIQLKSPTFQWEHISIHFLAFFEAQKVFTFLQFKLSKNVFFFFVICMYLRNSKTKVSKKLSGVRFFIHTFKSILLLYEINCYFGIP